MDSSVDIPVTVPGGRWVWVRPQSPQATLLDLANALAGHGVNVLRSDGGVLVDGRVVNAGRGLARAGVRAGSHVGDGAHGDPVVASREGVEVAVTAGEASGAVQSLSCGRFLLGSAEGLVLRVACSGVVPHAVAVAVDIGGPLGRPEVVVTHLAGPIPMVDGAMLEGTAPWPADTPLQVGAAQVRWSATPTAAEVVFDTVLADPPETWWRIHRRRGRSGVEPAHETAGETLAHQPPAAVNSPPVAPGLAAAATSAVMAAVVRQPWLALVGISSLLATAGWWLSARWRTRRRQARWAATQAEHHRVGERRARLERPALHDLVGMADGHLPGLWERRPHQHDDVWHVGVGRGSQRLADGRWWHDIPVVVALGPGARVGLAGAGAVALARAMIAHLVTLVGPADVSLHVEHAVGDERFSELEVLPHARTRAAHRVVLMVGPGPGQRAATEVDSNAAWVVVDDGERGDRVEAWCGTVLRWDGTAHDVVMIESGEETARLAPAGVTSDWLHQLVRRLVAWHDPEAREVVPVAHQGQPGSVTWADGHETDLDPAAVLRRWRQGTGGVPGVLGRGDGGVGGVVRVDLARDGPHALIAGTTGSGKSELLRTLVTSWAWHTAPDRLHLVLVDYKGGAAFDACAHLPHVVGLVTDLDGGTSSRVLGALRAELTRREQLMRAVGVSDVTGWAAATSEAPPPRLVIVVDELAALVHERPDVVTALVALAQRGRSLGVHLVLATQRPAGVVRDDVRANTELRVCLRVADRVDALDVVGDDRPASFDRRHPGRALVRSGAGPAVEVQVIDTSRPWQPAPPPLEVRPHVWCASVATATVAATSLESPGRSTLHTVVEALSRAARLHGFDPPGRLWQPPLPPVLELRPEACDDQVVGMLDDVDHQCWRPLRCDATGHAVVIGGPHSGVSTTLARIVATRGDHRVVEVNPGEPCAPVMASLLGLIESRRPAIEAQQSVTVLIDDVGAVRRRWEQELGVGAWQIAGWWDRLLCDGPGVGVVVVAGADRVASCGTTLLAVATTRWLMRPLDTMDPAHLGVRWPFNPGDVCPPGRLVDAVTGLVGQVAFSTPSTMCTVRSA